MSHLSSTSPIRAGTGVGRGRPHKRRASRSNGASFGASFSMILSDPVPVVDREYELEVIRGQLLGDAVRLLTLTGPGGIGKTRLALTAAENLHSEFADGVRVVELAPLRDAGSISSAIAQALRLHETNERVLWKHIIAHLADKHLLLVLDNFEHILEAAQRISELLGACPRVKALVTSRQPLNLRLEYRLPLGGLALPDPGCADPTTVAGAPSTALFLAHAWRVRPDLVLGAEEMRALAELLHRLDGVPLAIKFAASRSNALSPSAMLSRLRGQALLLTEEASDGPQRQRSLREVIDWSYRLLSSADRAMFHQLGVFSSGWTLDAAEAIVHHADADSPLWQGLALLVDKSLVQSSPAGQGERRFRMLETVREYATEQLAAHGELDALRQRHAVYYLTFAELAAPQLWGPQERAWTRQLEEEADNLRAALQWAAEQETPAFSLRLAGALAEYWWLRGDLREGRQWLDQALAQPGESSPAIRATALLGAGTLALVLRDGQAADAILQECQALADGSREPAITAALLARRGMLAEQRGEPAEAQALLERSVALSRTTSDAREMAFALVHLGRARFGCGDLGGGESAVTEGLALYRTIGNRRAIAFTICNLAQLKAKGRDYPAAAVLAAEGIEAADQSGDRRAIAFAALTAASLGAHQGKAARAAQLIAAVRTWGETTSDVVGLAVRDLEIPGELQGHLRDETGTPEGPATLANEVVDLARACLEPQKRNHEGQEPSRAAAGPRPLLSERERTILHLIGEGLPNKQIAAALKIAERTVKAHITSAMNKLGVDNRAHAAVMAVQRGLLK